MTGSIIYVAIVSFDIYAYTDKAQEPAYRGVAQSVYTCATSHAPFHIFLTSIVHFKCVFFDMIPS